MLEVLNIIDLGMMTSQGKELPLGASLSTLKDLQKNGIFQQTLVVYGVGLRGRVYEPDKYISYTNHYRRKDNYLCLRGAKGWV
jgi:hypothetical protein